MRKIIATRLGESKTTVPHTYLTIECSVDALNEVRNQLKDVSPSSSAPSMNDFIIKAMALALELHPIFNTRLEIKKNGEKAIQKNDSIDVSVAVATPSGLITPIITKANEKTVSEISIQMKDLAARAKINKLKPHEYQGGSISLSNLGMMGIDDFTAVLNPPQGAILAVGSSKSKFHIKKNTKTQSSGISLADVQASNVIEMALSVDARLINEVNAGKFLFTVKKLLEAPVSLFS